MILGLKNIVLQQLIPCLPLNACNISAPFIAAMYASCYSCTKRCAHTEKKINMQFKFSRKLAKRNEWRKRMEKFLKHFTSIFHSD